MNLLQIIRGRAIWLFDIRDLNPRGKAIDEDLVEWIKDSYSFGQSPKPEDKPQNPSGLAFSNGHFQVREEIFVEVAVTIYADGVVAETRSSTRDSEKFLEDLLTTATKEFGLAYAPGMIRSKKYLSELIVRPAGSLEKIGERLNGFAARVSDTADYPGVARAAFKLAGLSFWSDPGQGTPASIFSFERQVGKPFSEGRYYSQAPLHSDDHLSLLEEFERLLGD